MEIPGCKKYNPWPAQAICLPSLLKEVHLKVRNFSERIFHANEHTSWI
jgi:hypothetical protein